MSTFPWRYYPARSIVRDAKQSPVALLLDGHDEHGPLIAAAPDLEAALRELLDLIVQILGSDLDPNEPEIVGARSALAKARNQPFDARVK